MADGEASISIGASPVMADRRHTYLLFEHADGRQEVLRGGPTADGHQGIGQFAESTAFGSNTYGNIRVDRADYVGPTSYVYTRDENGLVQHRADQMDRNDPNLVRDDAGQVLVNERPASVDWPGDKEHHERTTLWKGSEAELQTKLDAATKAGQQINDAQLEYSPLRNNSNGVTSNLLKAADVAPKLPKDKDGHAVTAPNFGEDLYQDVGFASHRSGYRFDGKQWYDDNGQKIEPPKAGQPTVPAAQAQPDMRDESHPDHAMYKQAYDGVASIDRSMGRTPDEHTTQLAASLTARSKADGLDNIALVVMNDDRSKAYAVDSADTSNPFRRHTNVDVADAANQPVDVSNKQLNDTNAQAQAQAQQTSQQQAQPDMAASQAGPSMSGPSMSGPSMGGPGRP